MAIPSLAMIPSGYKDGKVYSVLPANGDGDFDFSRGSNATRVNKDGLIETVTGDAPRLDYTDSSCPSLLLEPQSTNLVTYSEDFSQWAGVYTSVNVNNSTSPDGNINAVKLTDTSDASTHRVQVGNTTSSSGSFCYSIFLKKGTLTTVSLSVYSGASAADSKFDLNNGTIVSTTNGTAEIQEYGNDWYRCIVKGTLASTSTTIYIYLKEKASYSGSGQFLYSWGAQLEEKSYATSYIPTNGTISTRLSELNTFERTDLVSKNLVGGTEMTWFLDAYIFNKFGTSVSPKIENTSNGNVFIGLNVNNDTSLSIRHKDGTSAANTSSVGFTNGQRMKVAVKIIGTSATAFINGVDVGDFTTASITSFDKFESTNGNPYNINDLRFYNTALTDQELIALTS